MVHKKLDARLEIRLTPEQLQKLKKEAGEKGASVGSLVREAIDAHYRVTEADKLEAVKQMAEIGAPVTSWETMKEEIEKGQILKR